MDVVIRDYRSDDWSAICRVHDRSHPDELRGSYDARAFIPLAEDPEGEYINACVNRRSSGGGGLSLLRS